MRTNKIAAIAAYISWIGFLIAIIIGDRTDRYLNHHLNQALVINILSIFGGALTIIPILGSTVSWLVSVAVLAFLILGIYRAATDSTKPLPIIGDIHIIG